MSLVFGSLFMLFSVPRYYGLVFNIEDVPQLIGLTQHYFADLDNDKPHPLLIGILLGCSISTVVYNVIRYYYTRYSSNLFLAIALGAMLLFSFFLAGILSAPTRFYVNFSSDFIYAPVVLCLLFMHTLCLYAIPKHPNFKRLTQHIRRHMKVLCVAGIALLVLNAHYAHLLTYYLLISSAVYLLSATLQLWRTKDSSARFLFIGFAILLASLIVVWPAFTNESFIPLAIAILIALIATPVAATVLSAGLSESHYALVVKHSSKSHQAVADQAEQRAKSEFLAKISHELRTPLSGVLGMSTLLLDTPLSSKQREYAQTLQGSGDELLTLINEILDISRLESKDIVVGNSQFNLAGLLQECTQAFKQRAQDQGVEFAVFLQPQAPETLTGDPVRLRQILLSVLRNAFQRTHQGEIVLSSTVEHSNKGSDLVFSVQDNGTRLSDDERHILSTAQLHSKDLLSTSFIGGNLGIIIANQLLSLMNGSLKIQQMGQGNVFTLRIPFNPIDTQQLSIQNDSMLHNKHILIIDSNTLYQKVLAQQCSEWGLRVSLRSSTTDAVAFLRNKAHQGQFFSAILISENNDKNNALEFAVRIKADPLLIKDTALIMLTSSSVTDAITARNAGIAYVLMKPISGSTLKTTLIRALDNNGASPATVGLTNRHILIVEDNLISVKVISGLLKKLGATVDVAANGQIGLNMMQTNAYDLVLMDCEMPIMDGFSAAQQRRDYEANHNLQRLPIFALSAHVLPEHKQRVIESGMDGHLAKPIELSKLQEVLQQISTTL